MPLLCRQDHFNDGYQHSDKQHCEEDATDDEISGPTLLEIPLSIFVLLHSQRRGKNATGGAEDGEAVTSLFWWHVSSLTNL